MAGVPGKHNPDEPATKQFRMVMTQTEMNKLDECVKLTGKSKSDIVREGINEVYKKYAK